MSTLLLRLFYLRNFLTLSVEAIYSLTLHEFGVWKSRTSIYEVMGVG